MSQQDSGDRQRIAHQRIRQVFEYLKALNEHRNPAIRNIREQPWLMWLDDLPSHPCVEFPTRLSAGATAPESGENSGPAFLLRVRRPKLTPPPTPPDRIRDWLAPKWDDPHVEAALIAARNEVGPDGETKLVRSQDDAERIAAFDRWLKQRTAWKEAELPARVAMAVFDRVYSLHGQLEREAERYDLVVGDGVLSWQQQDGNIYHPLLLQRAQLIFDAKRPEFLIVDADYSSELYTGMFQSVGDVDPRALRARRGELETGGYHPLDQEVSGFLEGFANQLSAQGKLVGDQRPSVASTHPIIGRAPVLFLRSRTKGFGTAIEQVLGSLQDRSDFCDALVNIVGCQPTAAVSNQPLESSAGRAEGPTVDVLFGKAANPEQVRIARAVDRHGAVLVQGPPGTGKSHTIANLIGHLLAQGKSVLVTSHTTKALKVLHGQLDEKLRPLCVSVLDNDMESRAQLEESVRGINHRLSESDADELEREAESLAEHRSRLLAELNRVQGQLLNARADEYRDIVIAGKSITPSDAARAVAAGRENHSWIPDPILQGAPCPLSAAEVIELYATNSTTCTTDDQYFDRPLPQFNELLKPDDLARVLVQSDELAGQGRLDRRFWPNVQFKTAHIDELSSLIPALREAVSEFTTFDGWKLAAVGSGLMPTPDGGPWDHLIAKIEETFELAQSARTALVRHRPETVDLGSLVEQSTVAAQIHEHLSDGSRLGWSSLLFRPAWKKSLLSWRTHGRQPETAEEIEAIQRLLGVNIARAELAILWDGLMAAEGEPEFAELGDEPERNACQYLGVLKNCRDWWRTRWAPLHATLQRLGFQWDRFLDAQPPDLSRYGEMRRIIKAVHDQLLQDLESTLNYLLLLRLTKHLSECLARLAEFDRPEVTRLRLALEQRNASEYAAAFEGCLDAANRQKAAMRRATLLSRLVANGGPAPAWAEAIRRRRGIHGRDVPPGDTQLAWEWRQLNHELCRRNETDIEQLGCRIEKLKDQIAGVTNDLIDRKAWAGQVRRTKLPQRQALMGWLSIVNRIGKGFTRRAPLLRREAQQKMEQCREAVPVWVMPLSRLVENFDFSEARFDVVIIDEASQCDVMALIAAAIARKVVVVGDDKQVSPSAVGQKLEIIDNLIKLHLDGIPNAVLYDGRMSIYELAKASFGGLICLVEHFRCVPAIIQFSNHLSYEGAIKPLREAASSPLIPHVVPYRVEGPTNSTGKVNEEEAMVVASLVVAAIEHEAYAGQTFGVISLVGDNQAAEIERLLLAHLRPDEYQRRRIICGNSAQFQGDERHVVFLSMVQSSNNLPLPMLDRPEFRQRYNVAASRARNQMWVVHSLNHETDLKPGDLRRRLVEHAIDPLAITRELESASQRTESAFEQQVLERLVRRGFRVRPQWPVGRYRIDLVVEGVDQRRAAVECDGDRFHPIDKLQDDMERQAILERLGWQFIRIRGTQFFREPDRTMESIVLRLAELGIEPAGNCDLRDAKRSTASEVVGELMRRAAALRREWQFDRQNKSDEPSSHDLDAVGNSEKSFEAGEKPSAAAVPPVVDIHHADRFSGNGEPSAEELVKYQEYQQLMRQHNMACRPLEMWLQSYRTRAV